MDLIGLDYIAFNDIENRLAEMLEDDMKAISADQYSSAMSVSNSVNSSNTNSSSSSPNSASYYSNYEDHPSFNAQFMEDMLSLGETTSAAHPGANYELTCLPPFVPYTDTDQDLFDSSVSSSPDSLTSSAHFSASDRELFNTNNMIGCSSSSQNQPHTSNEPIIRNLLRHGQQQHLNVTTTNVKIKNIDSSVHGVEHFKRFKAAEPNERVAAVNDSINRQQQQQHRSTLLKSEAFIPMTTAESTPTGSVFTTKHLSMRPYLPNLKIINRPPTNINMVKMNNTDSSGSCLPNEDNCAGVKTVIHYTKVYNGGDSGKAIRTANNFEATKNTSNDDKTDETVLSKLTDGKVSIFITVFLIYEDLFDKSYMFN
jgi:hypothetical protein